MAKQVARVSVAKVSWRAAPVGGGGGEGGGGSQTDRVGVSTTQGLVVPTAGVIPHSFIFMNLAASVSALKGSRDAGQMGVQMPYRGAIVALACRSSEAKTAGSVTFTPYVADEAQLAGTLTWSSGLSSYFTFNEGEIPFDAGEEVDVRATTSGFAPTTADVETLLYVTFSPE